MSTELYEASILFYCFGSEMTDFFFDSFWYFFKCLISSGKYFKRSADLRTLRIFLTFESTGPFCKMFDTFISSISFTFSVVILIFSINWIRLSLESTTSLISLRRAWLDSLIGAISGEESYCY